MLETSILALGPKGSNSHVAAIEYAKRLGTSLSRIQLQDRTNYHVVSDAYSNGHIGLVALENTKGGLVQDTVEALDNYRPKINGEHFLRVVHCLAYKGDLSDIKQVHSHPQAFRQCTQYLRKNTPWELKDAKSTSHAAELASQKPEIAAICTELAAEIYGLSYVNGIQDSSNNVTRFVAVSKADCKAVTGRDRTTLRYEVRNEPGTLWKTLGVWVRQGINLSGQHSIPTGESYGRYYQFAELEGHRLESKVQMALRELQGLVIKDSLHIFGSYSRHNNTTF